jgi:hypothetical protein
MDFRAVAAKIAGQAYSSVVPFSGPAVEALLSDLLGVQDEQLVLLKNLETSVQRLADVPWLSARIHLEDAAIPGRRPEDVRRSLEQAADKLHDAIPSQPDESPHKADARLMLSIVFAALQDYPASKYHAEIAYREARTAVWSILKKWPRMNQATLLKKRSAISLWYDDVEFAAATLGDPQASSVPLGNDGFPWEEIQQRAPYQEPRAEANRFRWRDGAPLDFAYIAYAQALRRMRGENSLDQFAGRPLAKVLEGPRNDVLPSPWDLQIEQEQRMGYFTGMEE